MEGKVEGINSKINKNEIPEWLLKSDSDTAEMREYTKRANVGFIRKTILSISKFTQNDLLTERCAAQKGLLQGIDPRVKLGSAVFYMLFAAISGSLLTLLFLTVVAVMLNVTSGLSIKSYLKRVWLTIPLIVFIVSIPFATNLFIPGHPLLYILKGTSAKVGFINLPQGVYISTEGIRSILTVSVRIGVSFSFGYLLVLTTRWSEITKALVTFRVPSLMISVLDMTYRYIFVLSKVVIEMFEARLLRTVGEISNKENRLFISGSVAALFMRVSFLSEEIYSSMLCRGYEGRPLSLTTFKIKKEDILWIINNVIIALILLLGELIIGKR
jgi:cobalt/nickel transport system permease protein